MHCSTFEYQDVVENWSLGPQRLTGRRTTTVRQAIVLTDTTSTRAHNNDTLCLRGLLHDTNKDKLRIVTSTKHNKTINVLRFT